MDYIKYINKQEDKLKRIEFVIENSDNPSLVELKEQLKIEKKEAKEKELREEEPKAKFERKRVAEEIKVKKTFSSFL